MPPVAPPISARNALPPLTGEPPQDLASLWAGFDPRSEPLETEVLREWESEGVAFKVVRLRIGTFRGRRAMLAGIYGHPSTGANLPALLQIHGGGQYAHYHAPLTNAKRGYATLSISWGGRLDAPGYRVSPDEVKLFWAGETGHPDYRLTTNWGPLDGYHAPNRHDANTNWTDLEPANWTVDDVTSPRNSNWFLAALAARRGLTFLERQPEVDPDRLGVYGHSMGGKLTVMVAGTDDRVKAAAPSCGGISDRPVDDPLLRATIGDDAYLRAVNCPVMFLSPSNDFHGRINDLPAAIDEIRTTDWRIACSPHHNHQDTAEYEVATQLWMDQHLKSGPALPTTPRTGLTLATPDGIPTLTVTPDTSRPVVSVDVYYTAQGQIDGRADDRENTMNRFWHHAVATNEGNTWTASAPLLDTGRPLWIYANVTYALNEPVSGAGYYYGIYTADRFALSSTPHLVSPDELDAAGVRGTLTPSLDIESFKNDWEQHWFTYRPQEWARATHKVYDPAWAAPAGARLALEVRCEEPNTLVIGVDHTAAELNVTAGDWQTLTLGLGDMMDANGEPRESWDGIRELRLAAAETLRCSTPDDPVTRDVGADWKGPPPEFRNLRWVVPA